MFIRSQFPLDPSDRAAGWCAWEPERGNILEPVWFLRPEILASEKLRQKDGYEFERKWGFPEKGIQSVIRNG